MAVAHRRDPAHRETGQVPTLERRGPPDGGLTRNRGQQAQVDSVATRDQADDRNEPAARPGGDEHERLDDLAQIRADHGRGLFGRVRGFVEDGDVELDALAGRRLDHPLDGRMREVAHGFNLHSFGWSDTMSIGPRDAI